MYRFSIHEIALFGKFLGPYFPSMVQYYRYSQQRQYSSKQKHCLNFFEGFDSLWEKDGPKVGTFGPTMTLLFLLKMAKIEKNKQQCRKTSVIELSKYVKMKSLSHLLFREKCNYFLQYLGYFYQGNRAGSQFKGVESKFDKYYFIHAIRVNFLYKNVGSNIFLFCGYRSQRTFRNIFTRIFKFAWFS